MRIYTVQQISADNFAAINSAGWLQYDATWNGRDYTGLIDLGEELEAATVEAVNFPGDSPFANVTLAVDGQVFSLIINLERESFAIMEERI